MAFRCEYRLSQSPSLLTFGCCSWAQREGLLSPEARQIYRSNYPSAISFVQSGTVLLMRHQLNPITPQNDLIQIQLNCVFFCGLYFDFALSPVFKYKPLVRVLSSSIGVLYQGRIFLAATEQEDISNIFLSARITSFLLVFVVVVVVVFVSFLLVSLA